MTARKGLFREEAIRHAGNLGAEGDLLKLAPTWTRWTYWILLGGFVTALLFAVFGSIHELAGGPAVVWIRERAPVSATVSGTVTSIEVQPGQRVEQGDLLVRVHGAREAAESEQREVRAPHAGVVGDVRIRTGQQISPGDIVVSLAREQTQCSIRAMIPAQHRPLLRPGMSLRFELTGYRFTFQEATITSVGAQVVGPREVQRYLGQEIDDTSKLEGPVVLVEARLPSCTFAVDGQGFNVHHGMSGHAEVRLRTQRILVALVPGLRVVLEKLLG
ncbi:MAG: HlyD family efflux transporter periplasmic adaptor subunit [Minicystis sp.]